MPVVKSMKNFRQADSRWGELVYKRRPYFMSNSGCGPTACADVISSNPKYKKITPKQIRKYMINNGFVYDGQGTAWGGITKCLEHYGFKVKVHTTMSSFFSEMALGGRRAIVLFRGGTKGGVTWTTGGHYVSCRGYKYKNDKHYLLMGDPGFRHNDGWYSYEGCMRGLVVQLWTATLPNEKVEKPKVEKVTISKPKKSQGKKSSKSSKTVEYPELPKKGYFKTGDRGAVNVKRLQRLLKKLKYYSGAIDGIYGDRTASAVREFQRKNKLTVDGVFGTKSLAALKKAVK